MSKSRAPAAVVFEGERWLRLHCEGKLTDPADLLRALDNKWYRLNTLYKIKDKNGKTRTFRPNKQQRERFIRGHCRNVILKARQLGFTTFEMIDALDDCLFTENFSAGCIAHALEDAKDIFRNKIKFAYDQLRQGAWMAIFNTIGLKLPAPTSDRGEGYVFDNGSSIRVSTSYRGGTLQRLHVSEFGKICRKYPDKAQEIVTGAFEAVGLGNQVTLESTAEGREGYFHDYCATAQKHCTRRATPTGNITDRMTWRCVSSVPARAVSIKRRSSASASRSCRGSATTPRASRRCASSCRCAGLRSRSMLAAMTRWSA